ncbi:MAG: copper homeostasis protein CutC [Tannerella sp.]|jgi:copper homeostasis protein|nr:copper homeostasis protein CutC [Tannerella sp.]
MSRILEVCANSAQSCLEAREGGAGRVELCASIPEGGTTPSYGLIRAAQELVPGFDIRIIVRPRGGDFLYTPAEVDAMLADISLAYSLGLRGVVVGCLTPEGEVDTKLLRRLVEAAHPMSVTFHRAFDLARDPFVALEQIIACGCDRLLTSGQAPTAEQGIPLLRQLVEHALGRIVIMPGCGIRAGNIARIEAETGAHEFHASARNPLSSLMKYRKEGVPMGAPGADEYIREETDRKKVAALLQAHI